MSAARKSGEASAPDAAEISGPSEHHDNEPSESRGARRKPGSGHEVLHLTALRDLPRRGRVSGRGYLSAVTIPPPHSHPQVSAVVIDSTRLEEAGTLQESDAENHRLQLIWLGRRHIPGIQAGVELRFEGMVAQREGLPTIYNPWYEIFGVPET